MRIKIKRRRGADLSRPFADPFPPDLPDARERVPPGVLDVVGQVRRFSGEGRDGAPVLKEGAREELHANSELGRFVRRLHGRQGGQEFKQNKN